MHVTADSSQMSRLVRSSFLASYSLKFTSFGQLLKKDPSGPQKTPKFTKNAYFYVFHLQMSFDGRDGQILSFWVYRVSIGDSMQLLFSFSSE